MAVVLRLEQASKAYGGQVLLDHVDLELTDEHRHAVIGRNGAGKSTLCRILLGEETLDSGEVWRSPDLRIAWLRQHDPWQTGETVLAFLMRDSGRPDWRCGEVAGRFGIKDQRLAGPIAALSGGWQTRVKLAAMLLAEPNLLVLDEPTNFLDIRTQLLLERFLADWNGGGLVVSHDRAFLERVCDRTLEVAKGRCTTFPQTVSRFLAASEEKQQRLARENANVAAKIKQLQWFVDTKGASAGTATQAKSKAKQIEWLREQLHELETEEAKASIFIPPVERRTGSVLRVRDLAIGYAGKALASDIGFELERGCKVVVMGDNGQGKTTLLRTLAGNLPPIAGQVQWTHGAVLGIYGQHVFGSLPEARTVRQHLEAEAPNGTERTAILGTAGALLFRGASLDKTIGVLSGGERARLVLAALLLKRHSVLVLDEPTNHLDVDSVDALATALAAYGGSLLVVTHDRDFAGRVAQDVVEIGDGKVRHWPAGWAAWLAQIESESAPTAPAAAKPVKSAADDKEARRRQYERDKKAASIERRIQKWQQILAECDGKLSAGDTTVTAQRADAAAKLAAAEEEWLAVQEEA